MKAIFPAKYWVIEDERFRNGCYIAGRAEHYVFEELTEEQLRKEIVAYDKASFAFEWKLRHKMPQNKNYLGLFPDKEYDYFPRAEIVYDLKKQNYIIYLDPCITPAQREEIIAWWKKTARSCRTMNIPIVGEDGKITFENEKNIKGLTRAEIVYTGRFYCHKCKTKRNELPRLYVTQTNENNYKIKIATDDDGVGILRTLTQDGANDCEDIAGYLSPYIINHDKNPNQLCRFEVTETPPSAFSVLFAEKTGIVPLYKTDKTIRYKILDGENRIGANLIELKCADTIALVECGSELEPTQEGIALRNEIRRKHYDACFITHCHGDHAGLLTEPINSDVIYMSEATLKILKIIGGICEENIAKTVAFDKSQDYWETVHGREILHMFFRHDPIKVKDFYFDYYLCDHSAYGSHMFHFISEKTAIFYTGDFRSNGRKDFGKLLEKLPHKVDTLICEGTNVNSNLPQLSEQDLENRLVELCQNDKPVFVLQSATNIDRIVSVYRAAVKSNRLFIMRLVQADICSELPNIPEPNGFKMCFAYPEFSLTDEQHKKYTEKYGKRLIGRERIAKIHKYILEVTSKDLHYLQKLAQSSDLRGAKFIYSTWSGYKEREDMKVFLDGVKSLRIEVIDLHASGHADKKAIDALRERLNPDKFIQVHKPKEN